MSGCSIFITSCLFIILFQQGWVVDEGSCSGTEEAVDPCQGVANVDELQEKCALMDKCKLTLSNAALVFTEQKFSSLLSQISEILTCISRINEPIPGMFVLF